MRLSVASEIGFLWAKSGVECGQIKKEDAVRAIRHDLERWYPDYELDEATLTVKEKK